MKRERERAVPFCPSPANAKRMGLRDKVVTQVRSSGFRGLKRLKSPGSDQRWSSLTPVSFLFPAHLLSVSVGVSCWHRGATMAGGWQTVWFNIHISISKRDLHCLPRDACGSWSSVIQGTKTGTDCGSFQLFCGSAWFGATKEIPPQLHTHTHTLPLPSTPTPFHKEIHFYGMFSCLCLTPWHVCLWRQYSPLFAAKVKTSTGSEMKSLGGFPALRVYLLIWQREWSRLSWENESL